MKHLNKKNPPIAIRATFSLPNDTAMEIEKLRTKFAKNGHLVNKSEVVRIGLKVLDELTENKFKAAVKNISRLKVGRPSLIEK